MKIYDRKTGTYEEIVQYGAGKLDFLYNNPVGRIFLGIAVSPFVSNVYASKNAKKSSVKKIPAFIKEHNIDMSDFEQTFLNTKPEDVEARVIDCYKSMFSEIILSYLVNRKIDTNDLKMSVVVQEMVQSDKSGICFTIDPVTGNDKTMLIEVSEGLGEDIVSGKTVPEQYHYNWYDNKETDRAEGSKLISAENVEKYAKVFAGIQQKFGYPCDIEFAIKDDELFILQSRRITKLNYSGINDIWSTADFKDGGVSATVCTPYMWSLYEYIWEYSLRSSYYAAK